MVKGCREIWDLGTGVNWKENIVNGQTGPASNNGNGTQRMTSICLLQCERAIACACNQEKYAFEALYLPRSHEMCRVFFTEMHTQKAAHKHVAEL